MKKIFTWLLVMLWVCKSIAQMSTVNARAGLTFIPSYENSYQEYKGKAGFTVGIFTNIPLRNHFSFQPNLDLLTRRWGIKNKMNASEIDVADYMLQLSINYIYTTAKNKGAFLGAGPLIRTSFYSNSNGENYPHYHSPLTIDLGLNLQTGYQFSHGTSLSINYTPSFFNYVMNGFGSGDLPRRFDFGTGYLALTQLSTHS